MQTYYSNNSPLASTQRFTLEQYWALTRLSRSSDIELTNSSIKILTSLRFLGLLSWTFCFIAPKNKKSKGLRSGAKQNRICWISTCQEIGSLTCALQSDSLCWGQRRVVWVICLHSNKNLKSWALEWDVFHSPTTIINKVIDFWKC